MIDDPVALYRAEKARARKRGVSVLPTGIVRHDGRSDRDFACPKCRSHALVRTGRQRRKKQLVRRPTIRCDDCGYRWTSTCADARARDYRYIEVRG